MPEGNGIGPRKGGREPSEADTGEQFQPHRLGDNAPLSSLGDCWPSHSVSWRQVRTKDPVPHHGCTEGIAGVGAERGGHGETRGGTMDMQREQYQTRGDWCNTCTSTPVVWSGVLVSVWSLAG